MNWDRIEFDWKRFTGNVKEQWSMLTDDQVAIRLYIRNARQAAPALYRFFHQPEGTQK